MSVSNAGLAMAYSPAGYAAQNKQNGKGFKEFVNKANDFAKKTGIISKSLKLAGDVSGSSLLKNAGKVVDLGGYGYTTKKKSKK